MATTRSDVVIVGAGPAGCSAAYDLCTAGYSVQLLDKAAFPRVKPCAGGLTIKAVQCLRYPLGAIGQRVCHDFQAGYHLLHSKTFHSKTPITVMTVRAEFDAFNLAQARKAGARFCKVSPVKHVERVHDGWSVHCDECSFQGSYLIGADGANSTVRRLTKPLFPISFAIAAEAVVAVANPAGYRMEMDFGFVDQGYAWIFPKGDHLNIGIYSQQGLPGIKRELVHYSRKRLQLDLDPKTIVGHRLPYGGHAFRHTAGMPLLVGDAAGLCDPLCGEGIYNALRSGQLAAQSIQAQAAGGADDYQSAMSEIKQDLNSYWRITRFFYTHLSWGYRLLCLPPVRYALIKGAALGLTTRETMLQLATLPFRRAPTQVAGLLPAKQPF